MSLCHYYFLALFAFPPKRRKNFVHTRLSPFHATHGFTCVGVCVKIVLNNTKRFFFPIFLLFESRKNCFFSSEGEGKRKSWFFFHNTKLFVSICVFRNPFPLSFFTSHLLIPDRSKADPNKTFPVTLARYNKKIPLRLWKMDREGEKHVAELNRSITRSRLNRCAREREGFPAKPERFSSTPCFALTLAADFPCPTVSATRTREAARKKGCFSMVIFAREFPSPTHTDRTHTGTLAALRKISFTLFLWTVLLLHLRSNKRWFLLFTINAHTLRQVAP